MRLTFQLKQWLTQNKGVKATSDDAAFRKAAAEALADGSLTAKKFGELSTVKSQDSEDEDEDEVVNMFKSLTTSVNRLADRFAEMDAEDETEDEEDTSEKAKGGTATKTKSKKSKVNPKSKKGSGGDDEDDLDGEQDEDDEDSSTKSTKAKKKGKKAGDNEDRVPSALEKMLLRNHDRWGDQDDDEQPELHVRVKRAVESYDGTKKAMMYPATIKGGRIHPLAGQRATDYSEPGKGRGLDDPSERDKAIVGAYSKFLINCAKLKSRRLAFDTLPEHDKDLLFHAMENEKWGGATDGGDFADIKERKLTPSEQKALIDDSVSGGLEAAPIVFDDMVITTPLLYGELYPLVNTVPIDRGRRIEGVATGTVTGSWGGVDDTAISLFNTASYVTAFDTTIFRWEGAVTIGLDFLSDTPIDFGAHFTGQYGERLLEDLDDVIATGNGTTQPEGVTVKSGTTSISFGGSTTIGNYESLMFSVAKPEKRANLMGSVVFCGSETSYMRARAIPVGASDARRLGGDQSTVGGVTPYGSYAWMGTPYKINESLGNTQIFYAVLARYRMYRRRGLSIRTSTEGSTLMRANEMLIIAMARYGGQLERGACAGKTSTAPA